MPKDLARPIKVGLLLPIAEETMAGATPRWADLKAIARLAEAGGFDSLWVPDHLIIDFTAYGVPAETRAGLWDCWSILAALAAVTTQVELGTIVACVGFRNPALLAKMADTIDEISGGRLILGLGAGYHEPEHRAFGYPFDHLVGRFEEALQIIHPLLRKGAVDFHGKYHQATECELRPRASRSAGPPILIGRRGRIGRECCASVPNMPSTGTSFGQIRWLIFCRRCKRLMPPAPRRAAIRRHCGAPLLWRLYCQPRSSSAPQRTGRGTFSEGRQQPARWNSWPTIYEPTRKKASITSSCGSNRLP